MATNSPRWTRRSTSRTARTAVGPDPKVFDTLDRAMTGTRRRAA